MKHIILLLLPCLCMGQDNKKEFYRYQDSFWTYRNNKDTARQFRILDSLDKYRKFDARQPIITNQRDPIRRLKIVNQ